MQLIVINRLTTLNIYIHTHL